MGPTVSNQLSAIGSRSLWHRITLQFSHWITLHISVLRCREIPHLEFHVHVLLILSLKMSMRRHFTFFQCSDWAKGAVGCFCSAYGLADWETIKFRLDGALSTRLSCRCPFSLQGSWTRWSLQVPSNWNDSMILWISLQKFTFPRASHALLWLCVCIPVWLRYISTVVTFSLRKCVYFPWMNRGFARSFQTQALLYNHCIVITSFYFLFFLTKQSRASTLIVNKFVKEAIIESHFHSSKWQALILECTLRHSLTISKANERRVPFTVDFVHSSLAAEDGFVLAPVGLVWYLVKFLLVELYTGVVFLSVVPQMCFSEYLLTRGWYCKGVLKGIMTLE